MKILSARNCLLLVTLLALLVVAGCRQEDAPASAVDQTVYGGLPVGFTEEGYPYKGDPEAPVTIQEFTDYLCPFCARHVIETEPALVEQYVRSGQVRMIFRDNPIASLHPTAGKGHEASWCVGEQGAAFFWAMRERLFAEQAQWSALPDPTDYLATVARDIGANRREYEACVASERPAQAVNATLAEAESYGYQGTPMFRLTSAGSDEAYTIRGAQPAEVFIEHIDALLAGEAPPTEESAEPESTLPFWASEAGLVPDPARPGYNVAGDPFKGEPGAPLTVVEFSDFQCPVCRTHALETQPALDERFVATGEVQWVFKHLPLRSHPQAVRAAVAAECGGDQGQFWPMHDTLFENVDAWSVDEPDAVLLSLAEGIGLDMDAFGACIEGRASLERVLADLYDAQDVSNSTPLFIVLYGGRGRLINGTLPLEQFTQALEEMLAEATAQ